MLAHCTQKNQEPVQNYDGSGEIVLYVSTLHWGRHASVSWLWQEGQHPLTGQRAANFSLLANQWAEQGSHAMTSRLPRYEAKCVQRRCFQWGSVPLRSDIKGTELLPANILIPLERQLIALQLCRWQFLYNQTLQQTFRPLLLKLSKIPQI